MHYQNSGRPIESTHDTGPCLIFFRIIFVLTVDCGIFKIKTGKKAKATRFANDTIAGLSPALSKIVTSNLGMLWRTLFEKK